MGLFWRDVPKRSLNSLLHFIHGARLSQINNLHLFFASHHHVDWLHIRVHKSTLIHVLKPAGHLRK